MMEHRRQTDVEQEKKELVASLRQLLEAQLAAGREGNLARVDRLGERANAVVEAIIQRGGIASAAADGGNDLAKLYNELILLLRAQQAEVQSKLGQLRRVKRAVGAYGGNDKGARTSSLQLG